MDTINYYPVIIGSSPDNATVVKQLTKKVKKVLIPEQEVIHLREVLFFSYQPIQAN